MIDCECHSLDVAVNAALTASKEKEPLSSASDPITHTYMYHEKDQQISRLEQELQAKQETVTSLRDRCVQSETEVLKQKGELRTPRVNVYNNDEVL